MGSMMSDLRSLEERGQIWRDVHFTKAAREGEPYAIRLSPCGHTLEVVGRTPQYLERCMECESKRLDEVLSGG